MNTQKVKCSKHLTEHIYKSSHSYCVLTTTTKCITQNRHRRRHAAINIYLNDVFPLWYVMYVLVTGSRKRVAVLKVCARVPTDPQSNRRALSAMDTLAHYINVCARSRLMDKANKSFSVCVCVCTFVHMMANILLASYIAPVTDEIRSVRSVSIKTYERDHCVNMLSNIHRHMYGRIICDM